MSSIQLHSDPRHQYSSRAIDGCLTPNSGETSLNMTNSLISNFKDSQNSNSNDNINNNNSNNNNNNNNNVSRHDSELSSVVEMPSPPLSPYARPSSTFGESDTRFAELVFPKPTSTTAKINLSAFESDEESIESDNQAIDKKTRRSLSDGANTTNNNSSEKKRSFPIEDLRSTSLFIDPYNDLKTPGYKRRQLKFLSQYKLVSPKYSVKKSTNSNSISNIGSTTASRFSTIPKNRFYHFNSSDTETEKPRTRRLVRESSAALESEDSTTVISRPSTPKRRKPVTNRRVDSPNSSSSTPQPYSFNYKLIPDYSPPASTLPNNNRCLKTEWKGQPMDLSNDPLINELHPAEVVLAATLRLPCNVYLDSKRRLFSEKVTRLKRHLPFRRTDAQKACKIDVNKASRLFASFEKVGWLKDSNFTQFL